MSSCRLGDLCAEGTRRQKRTHTCCDNTVARAAQNMFPAYLHEMSMPFAVFPPIANVAGGHAATARACRHPYELLGPS